jgi:choline dehydrogenase-like flavoprotein
MHHTGNTKQADVVIAGSGPGGATVARELSKAGKKVIICEKGAYHRGCGLTLSMISYFANYGFTFSKEGAWVLRPQTVGGASTIFMGTAMMPPAWLKDKYGIDVTAECMEFWNEVPIKPLSERLMQEAPLRIMEAARSMGIDWNPLNKMMRHDKCIPDCGKCASGCPIPGARWSARGWWPLAPPLSGCRPR